MPSGSWPGSGAAPTYFWPAVLCMVLFFPTGLAAVVYSLTVTRRQQSGDLNGSVRASQLARMWCIVTMLVAAAILLVGAAAGYPA